MSRYQLALEPNTVFFTRPPDGLPDQDLAWTMQEDGIALLERAGYEHYEISAFAQPGHRCRHNLNYWSFGDYLAVGAGAHGKISDEKYGVRRYRKPANPALYMETARAGNPDALTTTLGDNEIGFEFMLNALRLHDGFDAATFAARTGMSLAAIEAPLQKARADGLIDEQANGVWRPTPLGFRFLNELQGRFL